MDGSTVNKFGAPFPERWIRPFGMRVRGRRGALASSVCTYLDKSLAVPEILELSI
jgi:hypothetical protein